MEKASMRDNVFSMIASFPFIARAVLKYTADNPDVYEAVKKVNAEEKGVSMQEKQEVDAEVLAEDSKPYEFQNLEAQVKNNLTDWSDFKATMSEQWAMAKADIKKWLSRN